MLYNVFISVMLILIIFNKASLNLLSVIMRIIKFDFRHTSHYISLGLNFCKDIKI